MANMFIKSGEQPRYFSFSGVNSTTAVAASSPIYKESPYSSSTILIQVCNQEDTFNGVKANWITMGTITLAGTTTATDGFTTVAPWRYVRANVTAISASSVVEVIMGV